MQLLLRRGRIGGGFIFHQSFLLFVGRLVKTFSRSVSHPVNVGVSKFAVVFVGSFNWFTYFCNRFLRMVSISCLVFSSFGFNVFSVAAGVFGFVIA